MNVSNLIEVLAPGASVTILDPNPNGITVMGKIESVTLYPSGAVTYRVAWWHNGVRSEAEVYPNELMTTNPVTQQIGFK